MGPLPVPIQVECYAGFRGEERPLAFEYEGKRFRIIGIVQRWIEERLEAGRGRRVWFQVEVHNGDLMTIYYDTVLEMWFWTASMG
ncbi:MAG: hypothetical protein HY347_00505 [candidate division NC10 bacterium]|nr:hypothetical protein [candidate division NC10 bacterium]